MLICSPASFQNDGYLLVVSTIKTFKLRFYLSYVLVQKKYSIEKLG